MRFPDDTSILQVETYHGLLQHTDASVVEIFEVCLIASILLAVAILSSMRFVNFCTSLMVTPRSFSHQPPQVSLCKCRSKYGITLSRYGVLEVGVV